LAGEAAWLCVLCRRILAPSFAARQAIMSLRNNVWSKAAHLRMTALT